MIKIIKNGNIFLSPSIAIVNPVNTVGVMGKGLALEFKNRFPKNFNYYQNQCLLGKFNIGNIITVRENDKIIINFPTKKHWKDKSKYEYIEQGLEKLILVVEKMNLKSIAFPKIGCGLGGLDWNIVKNMIINFQSKTNENIEIYIYE